MRQSQGILPVRTRGRGLVEITREVNGWLAAEGASTGLLTVFVRHTSASLLVQENADPEVLRDLERWFARAVVDGDPLFRHVEEGPDDMSAHVRGALTQASIAVPVHEGAMRLGTWQGLFLWEHRHAPHAREIVLHYVGD
ncbi:MAG: secondary thiamine-phosphate synthase enzyme YjbQ [Alphaproteobacteria bacterium]